MFTELRSRRRTHEFALLGFSLTALACNGRTSYLDATGVPGHDEAVLGRWLTIVSAFVVVVICIAILAAMARGRRRERAGQEDARDASSARRSGVRSGLVWIYAGLAITLVILLGAFAGTVSTLAATARAPRAPAFTIDVVGHQWWWEVRYRDAAHHDLDFTTANEIALPIGEPVRVRLQSADVIHSFWLPQIAGKMDAIPGQVNEMWVQASRAGDSRGMCGEYCGLQHAMMSLRVTAQPREEFARWAAQRRAPAASPATATARAGQIVFQRTCGSCHAVAGTNALGRIGPDLTHVASRPFIAGGLFENTSENLARWIMHAPDLKEGSRMPALPLSNGQVRAVVAYLQTLR
jgi:cytochrome c oxidase subunit 2